MTLNLPIIGSLKKKKTFLYIFRSDRMVSVVRGAEVEQTREGGAIKFMYRPRNILESFINSINSAIHVPLELIGDPMPIYTHGQLTNQMAVMVNMDLNGNTSSQNIPIKIVEENKSLNMEVLRLRRQVSTLKSQLYDLDSRDRFQARSLKDAKHIGEMRRLIMTPSEQGFVPGFESRWNLGGDRQM